MTVAMALGREYAPLLTRTDDCQAGEWGREMNFTATIWEPPTPQPELFSLYEEEPGGTGPDRLSTLSGPQERVLRRTVLQIVDAVPSLPTLDDPAPQMVEQFPDIMHFFDTLVPDPEQVIEVPKVLPDDVLMRIAAEQLVEVSFLELNVDIPVVGGGGAGGGLHGFLPGQNYSLTAEQIVVNPVPRRSFSGDFHGFHPGQSSSNRTANKIADFPVPSGGPQDFPQTPPHRAGVSSDLPDEANQGFFLVLFTEIKKCEDPAHPQVRTGCAVEFMDAMSLAGLGAVGCGTDGSMVAKGINVGAALLLLLRDKSGYAVAGAAAGAGCAMVPPASHGGFWKNSLFHVPAFSRFSHLEIWTLLLCPRAFQPLFWCMGVACGVRCIGYFGTRALLGSTVDTCLREALDKFQHFLHCGELES